MGKQVMLKTAMLCMIVLILAGCAGKAPWYGNEAEGFLLQYRFPEGKTIRYTGTFNLGAAMERGDQQMELASEAEAAFGLKGKSNEASTGIQTVEAWAEVLKGEISSPQGSRSASFDKVLNKPFQIHMKPSGEVTGFGDVKDLRVGLDMNGPGRFNIKDFFVYYMGNFFLKLPDTAKHLGDTWTSEDTIRQELGDVTLAVTSKFTNTLAGYETVNGIKCLKIDVKLQSGLEGEGENGMLLEGDFSGKATFYFDFMNGRMVTYRYDNFGEATAAMRDRGTMSYTVESKMDLKLAE